MDITDYHKYPYIGLDTETTGLVYPRDRAFSMAIAAPDNKCTTWDFREEPWAIKSISEFTRDYKGIIIAHNTSFDIKMLTAAGANIKLEPWDDTVIRALLIDEWHYSYRLDDLAKIYLDEQKEEIWDELAVLFGGEPTRAAQIANLPDAPRALNDRYVSKDARLCLRLWEWQRDEIARQGIQDICAFERGLTPKFIRSELRGIRVCTETATRAMYQLDDIIKVQQCELNTLAGWEFNSNSSPQVKKLFEPVWDMDGQCWVANTGTPLGKTPKGGPSIAGEYLSALAEVDRRAALIQELRSNIKTRDTFLGGHVIGHCHGGRVYPNINQCKGEDGGTKWGRLSYTGPAMQQIPNRNKEVASIVKPCFLPDEGHVWVDTDMHSFEVRIFAHLVNSAEIIDKYIKDPEMDLHQYVADETGLPRDAPKHVGPYAKQLNLAMIFNQGKGATAMKMGLPWSWDSFIPKDARIDEDGNPIPVTYRKAGEEAQAIIDRYHYKVPGVTKLMEGCKSVAIEHRCLKTFTGRRIRFPSARMAYKASGLLIQATSADYNKQNWAMVEEELNGVGHMILNTHDSYSLSLPEDNWMEPFKHVKSRIERPGRARVPLILDLNGTGTNWWEAIS